MKNILITGVSGFIGFHTANKFLHKGFKVIGLDSIDNYYDVQLKKNRLSILKKNKNFFFSKIDITNFVKFKNIIKSEKIDNVIFLSAQAGVRYSFENPKKYYETNLLGFFNLCEIARLQNIKNIYFASSSSVYGNNSKSLKLNESEKTDEPISFYAATKKCNEIIAHSYSKMFGINFIGMRFFTVYGEYGRPDMSIFKFTKKIFENKKIEVFNNGNHARDFTNISDVSELIYRIYRKQVTLKKGSQFKIFNLCRGKKENLMKVILLISNNIGKKPNISYLKFQKGDVHTTYGSNKDVVKFTGHKPQVNIETGIKRFIDWYRELYIKT